MADDRPTAIVNTADRLTPRQRLFVNEYVLCLNATRAAIKAGYSADTARTIASALLTKIDIKAEVQLLMAARAMSRDEVLARIETQARGSLEPFLVDGVIDLDTEQARDNLGLIKRIRQRVAHGTRGVEEGEGGEHKGTGAHEWEKIDTEIDLHDPQRALETLARVHKLVSDIDVSIDLSLDDGARADSIAGMMGQVIDVTPRVAAPEDSAQDTSADRDSAEDSSAVDAITP